MAATDLRDRLAALVADEPALPDLIPAALAAGQARRRARRWATVSGLVLLVLALGVSVGLATNRRPSQPAGSPIPCAQAHLGVDLVVGAHDAVRIVNLGPRACAFSGNASILTPIPIWHYQRPIPTGVLPAKATYVQSFTAIGAGSCPLAHAFAPTDNDQVVHLEVTIEGRTYSVPERQRDVVGMHCVVWTADAPRIEH